MRTLWTPGWLVRHALVLILVATFLGLGWWQISRAMGGNLLSYAYAVEWPVFAGFVVYVWWREVRRALAGPDTDRVAGPHAGAVAAGGVSSASRAGTNHGRSRSGRPRSQVAYDDSDDPELAAYNHYLAWVNANPRQPVSDYPGRSR